MNNMIELYCELGDHKWMRESQRGKRPKNCPVHAPVKESSTGQFRTLRCEIGQHDWQAERKRGKPPRNCPEHAPKPYPAARPISLPGPSNVPHVSPSGIIEPKMRLLHCEGEPGAPETAHDYEVPSKRGKPPRWCEEHKPEEIKSEKNPKTIAVAIRKVLERRKDTVTARECKCGITVFTTRDELRAMNGGCKDVYMGWVCPHLNAVRKAIGD